MTDFPSYATGTVSVANGDVAIVGDGTIWTGVAARAGDTIVIGTDSAIIVDVIDDTHLKIDAWPFTSVIAGTSYKITWDSPLRYVGAQQMADVSYLISVLNSKGLLWYLPAGYTDPNDVVPAMVAEDGQGIIKIDTGALWVMSGGSWVSAGTYKGFNFKGAYDSGTAYAVNDVVTDAGNTYLVIAATTGNAPPNATYYSLLASKGTDGSDGATGATGATGPSPLTPIAAWVTATDYVTGPPASFVSQSGSAYECLIAHTSGASFNTDLAAGKWGVVASKGTDGAGTGDVVGPSSATDAAVVGFDGTTGKLVKELTAAEVRSAAGATTVGAALLTATDAAAARTAIGAESPTGQCRLSVASTTSLKLSPYNGDKLKIAGAYYAIPSSGVTVSNTGSASTLYYAYAYISSGAVALELSTTGHATDTTAGNVGVEIKSGDNTRTLVGMVLMDASNHFVDASTTRFVLNWFNRSSKIISVAQTESTTHATTPTDVGTTHATFITWADEVVKFDICGNLTVNNSGSGHGISIGLGVDGTSSYTDQAWRKIPSIASIQEFFIVSVSQIGLTETSHYATILAAVDNTIDLGGVASSGAIIYVTIRG